MNKKYAQFMLVSLDSSNKKQSSRSACTHEDSRFIFPRIYVQTGRHYVNQNIALTSVDVIGSDFMISKFWRNTPIEMLALEVAPDRRKSGNTEDSKLYSKLASLNYLYGPV